MLDDGSELDYDLYWALHRALQVVEASGLAVDGWSWATRGRRNEISRVYVIGDIANTAHLKPASREGAARAVAASIIARVRQAI